MASSRVANEITGLSAEQIEKSYAASWKAHQTPADIHYCVKNNPQEVIISFPASRGAFQDWYSKKPFGETEIDLNLFPSLRSIGKNESALVNEHFLQRFQVILANSSFKNEVEKAMEEKKQIVFAGHSSGGPVAILATLWAMETYPTLKPLCVTFGSPLIGDHIFSHAIRRENWSEYFFHFVMRYDIVPRILLAPLSSFDQRFVEVSQLIDPTLTSESSHFGNSNGTSEFYFEVMSNAATVTRHAACRLMGTTEATLETLANFVPLSLYRPFGTYIFCTTSGNEAKQIVMTNPHAILQVMFFSAQVSSREDTDEVSVKSLQQHFSYGRNLKLNVGSLDQLENFPFSEHTTSGGDIATNKTALIDLGLYTRARLCIQAAEALEEWKKNNEKSMEEKIRSAEDSMNILKRYKLMGHQKKGYYDAFKDQLETEDYEANLKRLKLAGVWDEIIEKLSNYELPDDFEGKKEWVEKGTDFRRLVEPLDIANYYRHSRNRDGRVYMAKGGRPKRYRYTQRWLEHAEKRESNDDVYSESCFWAEVEELCYNNEKSSELCYDNIKERVLDLEKQIIEWTKKDEVGIFVKDVFLEGSTFVKWWKTLPTEHKEKSFIKYHAEV